MLNIPIDPDYLYASAVFPPERDDMIDRYKTWAGTYAALAIKSYYPAIDRPWDSNAIILQECNDLRDDVKWSRLQYPGNFILLEPEDPAYGYGYTWPTPGGTPSPGLTDLDRAGIATWMCIWNQMCTLKLCGVLYRASTFGGRAPLNPRNQYS